jgi:DNA replication protein DnaC
MVDKYTDCAVLYIDDLFKQTYHGTPILTDADVKIAFTIFNARYLESKPTIISSEWDLETLLEADEGVFSRVYERCKGYTFSVPRDVKYNYRLARLRGQTA